MSISMATVSTRSAQQAMPLLRHDDDWYVEPASAVTALIRAETFHGVVWDPCCGGGTIPDAFLAAGITAVGSDLVDRAGGRFPVHDFLGWGGGTVPLDNIVTNPPYRDAQAVITKARTIVRHKVAAICRLAFLEGTKRGPWLAATGLSRVWVFSDRVSMPPGDKLASGEVQRGGGAVAYAWFVWEHGHQGPPTLGWLNSKGAA